MHPVLNKPLNAQIIIQDVFKRLCILVFKPIHGPKGDDSGDKEEVGEEEFEEDG